MNLEAFQGGRAALKTEDDVDYSQNMQITQGGGYVFTLSFEAAADYANQIPQDRRSDAEIEAEVGGLIEQALQSFNDTLWETAEDCLAEAERIEALHAEQRAQRVCVHKVRLTARHPLEIELGGLITCGRLPELIEIARADGHDAVIFREPRAQGAAGSIEACDDRIVVFDAAQITPISCIPLPAIEALEPDAVPDPCPA